MNTCRLKGHKRPIAATFFFSLFTKSTKGKEKRRYSVHVFWMEVFSEVRTCFLAETMAQVHPAAFSLLLALPVRHLSISLWAETRGTSCSRRHPPPPPHSQKFTSCASALLLRTDPIPETCINGPPHSGAAATGAAKASHWPPSSVLHAEAGGHFETMHTNTHRKVPPLSSLFPPAQIRSDSENTCENTCVLF